jgi:hypothetical protein
VVWYQGTGAIDMFSVKVSGKWLHDFFWSGHSLSFYFDGSPSPQVQSPIGDFFGAARFKSLPVIALFNHPDGTMVCRFLMLFGLGQDWNRKSFGRGYFGLWKCRITNYEWKAEIDVFQCQVADQPSIWKHRVNHFRHSLPSGSWNGRIVGASAYFSTSDAPASYGNWWAKAWEDFYWRWYFSVLFLEQVSEDYFNYSWSSPTFSVLPYCGQPGMTARVTGDLHQITDGIFWMIYLFWFEWRFIWSSSSSWRDWWICYGRMFYLYSLPGLIDDHVPVSQGDIREQTLPDWSQLR